MLGVLNTTTGVKIIVPINLFVCDIRPYKTVVLFHYVMFFFLKAAIQEDPNL